MFTFSIWNKSPCISPTFDFICAKSNVEPMQRIKHKMASSKNDQLSLKEEEIKSVKIRLSRNHSVNLYRSS